MLKVATNLNIKTGVGIAVSPTLQIILNVLPGCGTEVLKTAGLGNLLPRDT